MFRKIFLSGFAIALTASSAFAGPNCTCRFQGHNYKIGEVACILGDLKRCEMQLNNTSWQTITQGCPQAKLQSIKPATSAIPDPAMDKS